MKARDNEIIKESINGETYTNIAKKHGISRERVSQIINKNIIKKPSFTESDIEQILKRAYAIADEKFTKFK